MRMRKMKNLVPRTEACAEYRITEPAARQGAWRELMPEATALWVEVGCGKGKFAVEYAKAHPEINVLAVEKSANVIVQACEKAIDVILDSIEKSSANLYALCAGLTNETDLYNSVLKDITEYGYQFSPDVDKIIQGTKTVEDVFTVGKGDFEWK